MRREGFGRCRERSTSLAGATGRGWFGLRAMVLMLALGVAASIGWGCDTSRAESMTTLGEGLARFERNDHIAALRLFERAVVQDPTNAQAHYLVGLVQLQTYRDPNQALAPLARAVELAPDDAEFQYQYGIALAATGQRAQAAAALEAAIAADGEHARALFRLGELRMEDGDVLGAISSYSRAILADPTFEPSWVALGAVYVDHGRSQEALAVLENAIRINPESTALRAEIGRVYLELDEPDAAIGYLRQAAQRTGAPASVHYNLGVSLRARHARTGERTDRDDAILSLNRALGQCNPVQERTRCASIQAMIRDLEQTAQ